MISSRLVGIRRRLQVYLRKGLWGLKAVGPRPVIGGLTRLVELRVRQPHTSELKLVDGTRLGFKYPSQLVPALVVFGDYIDPEYPLLRKIAKSDWTVVDVGAAIGQFTIFAARLPVKSVHAYEPSGSNVETLEKNIELNAVSASVQVHRAALTKDSIGTTEFLTNSNPFMSQLSAGASDVISETVVTSTLSNEARNLGIDNIDCLKVNVAGFEPDVLAGAFDLFSEKRVSCIIVLVSTAISGVLESIKRYGYEFYFYHPKDEVLHRLVDLGPESLTSPPWPARHVIGLSNEFTSTIQARGIDVTPSP